MVTSTKSSDLLVCVFLVRIRFILLGRVFQGFGVCVCVCTCLVALKGLGFMYSFVVVQGFKGSGFAPHSRLGRARDRIQHCAV